MSNAKLWALEDAARNALAQLELVGPLSSSELRKALEDYTSPEDAKIEIRQGRRKMVLTRVEASSLADSINRGLSSIGWHTLVIEI